MSFTQAQLDMFKNMPGLDDEDDEDTGATIEGDAVEENSNDTSTQSEASPGSTGQASTTTVAGTQPTVDAPAGGGNASNNRAKPGDGTGSAPKITGERRPDGLVAVPVDPANPKVTNLVDPISGQVVVAAGVQRRLYERGQSMEREVGTLQGRIQQYEAQINAYKQADTAGTQLGLSPVERTSAMQMMADYKKDPVGTLQRIVEEMQAQGIELPFLQNGGNSAAVLNRMLDDKLKPFLAPQEASRVAQAAEAQAKETLDNFLSVNEDAAVHLPLIAQMLERDPRLTLDSAYMQLMRYAMNSGLTLDEPLPVQLARRQNATGAQPSTTPPANAENRPATRPLPNGRAGDTGTVGVDDVAEFGANDSWDTIIRSTLASSRKSA